MRTTTRALCPDSHPESPCRTREDVEATRGSVRPQAPAEGGRRRPPSILRRSWLELVPREAEPPRTLRHVRFREPVEEAVHYIACREPAAAVGGGPQRPGPRRSSPLLWLTLCILLGVALGLYHGWAEPMAGALEDLRAQLRVLALRLWHVALSSWHCLLRL
ncbi:nutritionally-regulated adipose and cardiac enriched protein homolog [Heterocephalus glaber]|uniref:Nutritionally-regulated adipose and cardiac enriched protein homolog n=1 Tax=Heterocephalus glaber TaxID=10181 RepID=A0A0P6JVF1_HETGA|nr:nutritionally-regulated adipose and cardiac enriched protein homolog [Heterocephalus glaber]XP_012921709.1 nutritionally-regulated adipose and cardiac enriched protein homolog [Heterocephalus glaber]XP_021099301.1 nutritionally-regulated adipose and cardiac enriched protein homolog [Heterocephalus glaber]